MNGFQTKRWLALIHAFAVMGVVLLVDSQASFSLPAARAAYGSVSKDKDLAKINVLKRNHELNERTIESKQQSLNATFNELTTLSQKINRLKEDQLKSYGIFRELRLKYLLSSAEEIERRYTKEHTELLSLIRKNDEIETEIVETYKDSLDQLITLMKKMTNKNTKEFVEIFNQYLTLLNERESFEKQFSKSVGGKANVHSSALKVAASEQGLPEQVDVLISMQDRLKKNIVKLERELKSLYEKKQLINQLKQFEDEISFFSDEFFIANATKPSKSETPAPVATETPSGGDTGTPEPLAEPTPDPTDGSADDTGTVDSTSGDDSTGPSVDDAGNDPGSDVSEDSPTFHSETGTREGLLTPYKSDIDTASSEKKETNLNVAIRRLLNEKRNSEAELRNITEKIRLLEIEKKAEWRKKK